MAASPLTRWLGLRSRRRTRSACWRRGGWWRWAPMPSCPPSPTATTPAWSIRSPCPCPADVLRSGGHGSDGDAVRKEPADPAPVPCCAALSLSCSLSIRSGMPASPAACCHWLPASQNDGHVSGSGPEWRCGRCICFLVLAGPESRAGCQRVGEFYLVCGSGAESQWHRWLLTLPGLGLIFSGLHDKLQAWSQLAVILQAR